VAVKFRAAMTLLTLLDVDRNDVRGGLYGYYAIALLSACFFSSVFSAYNVDEKLAKHLPTPRNFEYGNTYDAATVAQALVGSLPLAACVALIGYCADLPVLYSGLIGVLLMLPTAILIIEQARFAYYYRQLFEMRFVPAILHQLDRLHGVDKAVLTVGGVALTSAGVYKDNAFLAAPGQALLFMMTTAWAAEKSTSAASALRYIPVQMLLYAAALITWILNCVLPLHNMMHDQDPKNRPSTLAADYFQDWRIVIIVGSLIAGAMAGFKDYASTGSKLPACTHSIALEARRRSIFQYAGEFFRKRCTAQTAPHTADMAPQPLAVATS
jgi:hypothetical protein